MHTQLVSAPPTYRDVRRFGVAGRPGLVVSDPDLPTKNNIFVPTDVPLTVLDAVSSCCGVSTASETALYSTSVLKAHSTMAERR